MSYDDLESGTFAQTEWTDKASGTTLHAGDVVRMNGWSAFADSVILGFNKMGDAKVSRPYAYAQSTGTTCASVLLGAETYTLPAVHILTHYKVIENDGHRAR